MVYPYNYSLGFEKVRTIFDPKRVEKWTLAARAPQPDRGVRGAAEQVHLSAVYRQSPDCVRVGD